MIFATYWFVIFVAVALPVYWSLPRPRLRLWFLLGACLVFHQHFAGPAGMLPIIGLAVATYGLARVATPFARGAGILLCVVALAFYKYSGFIWANLSGFVDTTSAQQLTGRWIPAQPPLAISFFTFEFVHYLTEVQRGRPPIRKVLDFSLFTVFFPSLVAGPIKRYEPFLASLRRDVPRVTIDDVAAGLVRVATGYVKKVVIADNLTPLIDYWVPRMAELGLASRWGIVTAIAFRILMDFSGYSDIAIGLARMLGIRLPENFEIEAAFPRGVP